MPEISVILITFNEASNLERCLRSVEPFAREILVVDSHSTDQTGEIARRFGARVITRDWPGYGAQKQFALKNAACEWVFSIDADEEVSPELCREIQGLDFARDGYLVPRRTRYMNRWIMHGGWYPGEVLRLLRRDRASFTDRIVHESAIVSGSVGRLRGDLLHYSYRNVGHHVEKINHLTALAAEQMHAAGRRAGVSHLVFLPAADFLRMYLARLGFLDGYAGLVIAVLRGYYTFLKYVKLRELQRRPE